MSVAKAKVKLWFRTRKTTTAKKVERQLAPVKMNRKVLVLAPLRRCSLPVAAPHGHLPLYPTRPVRRCQQQHTVYHNRRLYPVGEIPFVRPSYSTTILGSFNLIVRESQLTSLRMDLHLSREIHRSVQLPLRIHLSPDRCADSIGLACPGMRMDLVYSSFYLDVLSGTELS